MDNQLILMTVLKHLLTSKSMTNYGGLSKLIFMNWDSNMQKIHNNKLIEMTSLHHILRSPVNNRQIVKTYTP